MRCHKGRLEPGPRTLPSLWEAWVLMLIIEVNISCKNICLLLAELRALDLLIEGTGPERKKGVEDEA